MSVVGSAAQPTAFSIGVAHVVCGAVTVIVGMSRGCVDSYVLTPVHLPWGTSQSIPHHGNDRNHHHHRDDRRDRRHYRPYHS